MTFIPTFSISFHHDFDALFQYFSSFRPYIGLRCNHDTRIEHARLMLKPLCNVSFLCDENNISLCTRFHVRL